MYSFCLYSPTNRFPINHAKNNSTAINTIPVLTGTGKEAKPQIINNIPGIKAINPKNPL